MSRNYRDDPNKVPLGDRRPWPSSSNVETGISSGGSLLNPSYLSGMGGGGGGSGKESSSSAGNGNTSFSSIPSKFSQEFQSRWSSMPSEYGDITSMQVSKMNTYDPPSSLKRSKPIGMFIYYIILKCFPILNHLFLR